MCLKKFRIHTKIKTQGEKMKYEVLYDTIINKAHTKKGSVIEFDNQADSGYIKRLINSKVIIPLDSALKEESKKEKTQERLTLEEKAKELGIKFQDNTKDETLAKKIEESLAKE